MERKEQTLTFYSPEVSKVKGNRKYQRPTLPTNKQSISAQKRQQYVDQAYLYTRMFSGSLSGFSLLLLICTSPLSWVQFLVTNNGLELNAGLWTLCNHELCWSHTPKPPYYLQYSRALFIISILCMLTGLGLLFSSCRPAKGILTSELDLKLSILSFCSGIISFLNYITFQSPTPDQSDNTIPWHKSRLQKQTTSPPTTPEKSSSQMQFLRIVMGVGFNIQNEQLEEGPQRKPLPGPSSGPSPRPEGLRLLTSKTCGISVLPGHRRAAALPSSSGPAVGSPRILRRGEGAWRGDAQDRRDDAARRGDARPFVGSVAVAAAAEVALGTVFRPRPERSGV
ncbi:transmembrane protein 202 [Cricetulus griseus]